MRGLFWELQAISTFVLCNSALHGSDKALDRNFLFSLEARTITIQCLVKSPFGSSNLAVCFPQHLRHFFSSSLAAELCNLENKTVQVT